MEGNMSVYIAFMAGLLSFVSPCVLPIVPSYISYITGLSLEELTNGHDRAFVKWVTMKNSLMFILGFSSIFIGFGASASFIGQLLLDYQDSIRTIGGLIIIFFGLYVLGVFKLNFLMYDKRLDIAKDQKGILGSFLVGMGFAAGWTPCVGPILGTILLYASTSENLLGGVKLLTFYSLGLALPLFIISLGINRFLVGYKKLNKHMWIISKVSGVFLILVGVLVISNSLAVITAFLSKYNIGWTVEF